MASKNNQLFLGLDAGTSGIRAVAINRDGGLVASASERYASTKQRQSPNAWLSLCVSVLDVLSSEVELDDIEGMAVDGQSGTVLLCDADGQPLSAPKFYHEPPSEAAAELFSQITPNAKVSVPATLGRVVDLWRASRPSNFHITHQADWISGQFCGRFNFSDENNSLKLGYDPAKSDWVFNPDTLPFASSAFPAVNAPAHAVGPVSARMAAVTGLSPKCQVYTGTTDGIAGFLAANGPGKLRPGAAVTSLGTTMVLKAVSPTQVDVGSFGIYSHKLFDYWLAGGASNSGGGALLKHFSSEEMTRLSSQIDPEVPSDLDYYPLSAKGERFPVSDPNFVGRTTPRPDNDVSYLAGLLEGIARIEKRGYDLLHHHGVPYPELVKTVGGGSRNETWRRIRERVLGVPVVNAKQSEAAYGAALLAELGVRGAK
jgi:D-ribulokinase